MDDVCVCVCVRGRAHTHTHNLGIRRIAAIPFRAIPAYVSFDTDDSLGINGVRSTSRPLAPAKLETVVSPSVLAPVYSDITLA